MNCNDLQNTLPELLFTPQELPADVQTHLQSCAPCEEVYASFQSTFALLDTWSAPDPSAFFDQKLAVRLREEAAAPPAGWFERLRTRLLFNTGAQFRPVLAGAMAAVLLVGGGAFVGLTGFPSHQSAAQVSAAVGDLQILDRNDQAFQQMDQLLQDDSADDASDSPVS